VHSPLNIIWWKVPESGGGAPLVCGVEGDTAPWIFIDHSDGLKWAFRTHVIKKTCTLMVCDVPLLRSSPSLGEVLHENQFNLHFDPRLLYSWVVMNIINGIARGAV